MANKVLLKKSSVSARVPTTSDLDYGEVAINYTDGKIYYKNSSNAIKSFIDEDGFNTAIGEVTLDSVTDAGNTTTNSISVGAVDSSGDITTESAFNLSTNASIQFNAVDNSIDFIFN